MVSRLTICLVAGMGSPIAMVAAAPADDRPMLTVDDGHAVERAFGSLLSQRAMRKPACSDAITAADVSKSPLGSALIRHAFACEPSSADADAPGGRLAASFAAVTLSPGAGDGEVRAPFALSFHRFGFPDAIAAREVLDPTPAQAEAKPEALPDAMGATDEAAAPALDAAAAVPAPLAAGIEFEAPIAAAAREPDEAGQVDDTDAAPPIAPEPLRLKPAIPAGSEAAADEVPAAVATHKPDEAKAVDEAGATPPAVPEPQNSKQAEHGGAEVAAFEQTSPEPPAATPAEPAPAEQRLIEQQPAEQKLAEQRLADRRLAERRRAEALRRALERRRIIREEIAAARAERRAALAEAIAEAREARRRRAAFAAAAARRRAARTVSVSRTVRLPRRQVAAERPQRIGAAAPAAPAPQARSFSPKMSSAGPARPTTAR